MPPGFGMKWGTYSLWCWAVATRNASKIWRMRGTELLNTWRYIKLSIVSRQQIRQKEPSIHTLSTAQFLRHFACWVAGLKKVTLCLLPERENKNPQCFRMAIEPAIVDFAQKTLIKLKIIICCLYISENRIVIMERYSYNKLLKQALLVQSVCSQRSDETCHCISHE